MKERAGVLIVALLVVANVFLIPLAFKNAQGPATDSRPTLTRSRGRHGAKTDPPRPKRSASPDERAADDTAPLLMTSGGRLIVSSTRGVVRRRGRSLPEAL